MKYYSFIFLFVLVMSAHSQHTKCLLEGHVKGLISYTDETYYDEKVVDYGDSMMVIIHRPSYRYWCKRCWHLIDVRAIGAADIIWRKGEGRKPDIHDWDWPKKFRNGLPGREY